MSSLQTRIAQGAARDAEADWKAHRVNCLRCSRLTHDRYTDPCGTGPPLRDEAQRLRAQAKRESELGKAVPEGQEALF